MPKQLTVQMAYDSATRQLVTTMTGTGFIAEAPERALSAIQTDTITLFPDRAMRATDQQALVNSLAMCASSLNMQLARWQAAYDTRDLADTMLALDIDPAQVFEDALVEPTVQPTPTPEEPV